MPDLDHDFDVPFMKFWVADYLSSSTVNRLSASSRGIFTTLLFHQWQDGYVPNDVQDIAFMCNATEEEVEVAMDKLDDHFEERDGGEKLVNPRAEEEYNEVIEKRRKRSKAGSTTTNNTSSDQSGDESSDNQVNDKCSSSDQSNENQSRASVSESREQSTEDIQQQNTEETEKEKSNGSADPSFSSNGTTWKEKFDKWWNVYLEEFKDIYEPRKKTQKRKRKFKRRLETYDVDEIIEATRKIAKSDFHCGANDRNKVYAKPEFILRNDEKIEEWLNYEGEPDDNELSPEMKRLREKARKANPEYDG